MCDIGTVRLIQCHACIMFYCGLAVRWVFGKGGRNAAYGSSVFTQFSLSLSLSSTFHTANAINSVRNCSAWYITDANGEMRICFNPQNSIFDRLALGRTSSNRALNMSCCWSRTLAMCDGEVKEVTCNLTGNGATKSTMAL